MSPISRRVLLHRNATQDWEHVLGGARVEIRRVARGVGKDTGQQNYERKRKDDREEEEKRERGGR